MFFCPFISERFIVELTVGCLSLNNRCTWFVFCFIQFSKVYFVCLVLTRQLFNSTKTFLTCQHLFEKFFYFLFLRSWPVVLSTLLSYQILPVMSTLFWNIFVFFYFWKLPLEVIRGIFTLFMAYFRPFTVYRIFICFFTLGHL